MAKNFFAVNLTAKKIIVIKNDYIAYENDYIVIKNDYR